MLELKVGENTWNPPDLSEEVMRLIEKKCTYSEESHEKILFLRIRPYIDLLYVDYKLKGSPGVGRVERFVFHENYVWTFEQEQLFAESCLNNQNCKYKYGFFDEIYDYYNEIHPEWKLKRYYTESVRLLDHIYHCMRKNTVKELLYKCGLDMLAKFSDGIDDFNLLAGSPSEVYGDVPMRALRRLNCEEAAKMLCHEQYRNLFKVLASSYSTIFDQPLNDAQCAYIKHLYDRKLTPKEIGRLYLGRRSELSGLWNVRQFKDFLSKLKVIERVGELGKIDQIYEKYLCETDDKGQLGEIEYYLLGDRKHYDRMIRVSNRKRNYAWQERDGQYVVRYPQTINDFCREAVYMSNCLLGYVDAFMDNTTTIMFLRREENVNEPFITMEIYKGELTQAYHRFNQDCTTEEAIWIKGFCYRHGIGCSGFYFDRAIDLA
ncbi:PcfJ domain-containing protein [Butyrivibrio sp. NC2002]|uniref:PcfJ domain-containing protein n=1 Tax=Butyrivibrio sp. NC2002 TaxID=1410610 RepID=UPI00056CBAC8|nr:PcfJ domain-containing protein [Butyrivibrio sp. NC2002]